MCTPPPSAWFHDFQDIVPKSVKKTGLHFICLNLTPTVIINIEFQILGYHLEGYIYVSKILVLGLKTYFYPGLLCKAED